MTTRVVSLRKPRGAPKEAPPAYAGQITTTERAAAEAVMRGANRLAGIYLGGFTTTTARARVPAICAEIANALAELQEESE